MTAVASVIAPAAAISPAAPLPHADALGGQTFSAALDALTTGDGKARSTDDERRQAARDADETAAPRAPADLRAALLVGALASMTPPATSGAAATATAVDGSAGGTGSPSRPSFSAPEADRLEAAHGKAASSSGSAAKLIAERSHLAPAGFAAASESAGRNVAPAAGATAQTPTEAERSAPTALSSAKPPEPGAARVGAAPAPDFGSFVAPPSEDDAGRAAERGNAVAPTDLPPPAPNPASAGGRPAADDSTAASAAGGGKAAPRSAAASPAAPRRRTSEPARETGTTAARPAIGAGSPAPSKAEVSPAPDPGAPDRLGRRAPSLPSPATVSADTAFLAPGPAPTTALTSAPAETTGAAEQTTAPAAQPQTPSRVREIDVDLASAGIEDVTMTVRLAGNRLGVVVRTASGQTAATIEGARDAISDRLAAIGQPVGSFIIQQTGASDATGRAGQSTGEGDGGARQGDGGDARNRDGSGRGASRF